MAQIYKIRNEKAEVNNQYHRKTEDCKRLLRATICQQKGQPRRNGQTLGKIQSAMTELWRNRKYEWANYQ